MGTAESAPEIQCPNCGAQTPAHTFCAECGVALRALPKSGAQPQPGGQPPPGAPPAHLPVRGCCGEAVCERF